MPKTLYEIYSIEPLEVIECLCKPTIGDSVGRVSLCGGILPGEKGNVTLYLTDLLTNRFWEVYIPEEDLKKFEILYLEDLDRAQTKALEKRVMQFAEISKIFSELVKDPNAGKGPEHFY
jgi:hypothetical protein